MTMTYLPQELIRKKRDGLVLSDAEIVFMVQGITSGQLSDAQLGAFAMAVFQRGMTMPVTRSVKYSAFCLELNSLPSPL